MQIKIAKLKLRLPYTNSLKDKRSIVKSLIAKTRQEQQAAISEVEDQDDFRSSVIGVALVSNDAKLNESVLQRIYTSIEHNPEIIMEDEQVEEIVL